MIWINKSLLVDKQICSCSFHMQFIFTFRQRIIYVQIQLSSMTSNQCQNGNLGSPLQISNNLKKYANTSQRNEIQKLLASGKITEADINQGLLLCLENYKFQQQSDDCLSLFLKYRANPNFQQNNRTPLIISIEISQLTPVKMLLQAGAKPDLPNSLNQTPLQFLLKGRRENYEIADALISAINNLNYEIGGKTPLQIALDRQFDRFFKILVDRGCNTIYPNENILHQVMKKQFRNKLKKKKIIKFLHEKNVNPAKKDYFGKTPLQYEEDIQIRNYYEQIFKPKINAKQETAYKDRNKQKEDILNLKNSIRNSEKDDKEGSITEDISFDEDNVEALTGMNKIKQINEDDQEDKVKIQEEKDKKKKANARTTSYYNTIAYKKVPKIISKVVEVNNTIKSKKSTNQIKKKNNQPLSVKKKSSGPVSYNKKIQQNEEEKKNEEELTKRNEKKGNSQIQKKAQKSTKQNKNEIPPTLSSVSFKGQLTSDSSESAKFKDINANSKLQEKLFFCIDLELSQDVTQARQKFQHLIINERQSDSSSQEDQQADQTVSQQLTKQIEQLVQEIDYKNLQDPPIIEEIIQFLKFQISKVLRQHLQKQQQKSMNVMIQLYGSQANNLSVAHSDIDLLITTPLAARQIMQLLQKSQILEKNQYVEDVKYLKQTSMPIIKLQYKSWKVDVAFQIRGHTGVRCNQLIQQFMAYQPLLRPLVLSFKTLLKFYDLCDTYTGGLGSYSLTLMIIAVLQSTQTPKKPENLGVLFMQFLSFYGYQMDYICEAIIIHPPGFSQKPVYNLYQLPPIDIKPKLIIYDPLNPVNNVGRGTYRVLVLKKLFTVWYNRLNGHKCHLRQLCDRKFLELLEQYV